MKANSKKIQTIKMVAFNNLNRKWEEVFPEDEVEISKMVPMFWSAYDEKFMTVPDVTVASVYDAWAAQIR